MNVVLTFVWYRYSCCLYPKGTETLAQAERAMLELYVERAQLKDGMKIFDLGYALPPSNVQTIWRVAN